jgi:hypothetical protein
VVAWWVLGQRPRSLRRPVDRPEKLVGWSMRPGFQHQAGRAARLAPARVRCLGGLRRLGLAASLANSAMWHVVQNGSRFDHSRACSRCGSLMSCFWVCVGEGERREPLPTQDGGSACRPHDRRADLQQRVVSSLSAAELRLGERAGDRAPGQIRLLRLGDRAERLDRGVEVEEPLGEPADLLVVALETHLICSCAVVA